MHLGQTPPCRVSEEGGGRLTSTSCLLASTRMGTPSRASLMTIFSGIGKRKH